MTTNQRLRFDELTDVYGVAQASSTLALEVLRHRAYLSAIGVLSGHDPRGLATGAAPTSQTIWGTSIYLFQGEVVTNILVCVTTAAAGAAPSALKLGLFDTTPTCLAVTADLSADAGWTSTGWKPYPLTAAYTVPASGIYYPVFWINGAFGGTNVQIGLSGSSSGLGSQIGSNPFVACTLGAGKATLSAGDAGTFAATSRATALAVS